MICAILLVVTVVNGRSIAVSSGLAAAVDKKGEHKMKQWKGFLCGVLAALFLEGIIGTAAATVGTKAANLEYSNIQVTLDGVPVNLADGSGNPVEPFIISGTTYLPVRAIANAFGLAVDWDAATQTVILKHPSAVPGTQDSSQFTMEQAKAAALAHAGLMEKEVTFTKEKVEWDDGRQVYEIEFYTADYKEYDYEIDAATGKIVSADYDAESYTPSVGAGKTAIDQAKAQEIALAKVPGAAASHVKDLKLDQDDGKQVYEVKIIYNGMEYQLEIDAANGAILEFETESIYD